MKQFFFYFFVISFWFHGELFFSIAELAVLKELLSEAEEQRFPETEVVVSLREAVETADKCAMIAQQLVSSKVRTRTRLQGEAKCRLSIEELGLFVQQLKQLPCKLPESDAIYSQLFCFFFKPFRSFILQSFRCFVNPLRFV